MTFDLALPLHSNAPPFDLARLDARGPLLVAEERPEDVLAREKLLDAALGPARRLKTCERLREGRLPAPGLALAAHGDDGRLAGTLRLWPVLAGPGRPALLLGPLAVAGAHRERGLGGALMREGLARAAARGWKAVLLVGDAPYYARFGFARRLAENLVLPGPVEAERFLGLELVPGALDGARGLVAPAGALAPRPERHPGAAQRRAA